MDNIKSAFSFVNYVARETLARIFIASMIIIVFIFVGLGSAVSALRGKDPFGSINNVRG